MRVGQNYRIIQTTLFFFFRSNQFLFYIKAGRIKNQDPTSKRPTILDINNNNLFFKNQYGVGTIGWELHAKKKTCNITETVHFE